MKHNIFLTATFSLLLLGFHGLSTAQQEDQADDVNWQRFGEQLEQLYNIEAQIRDMGDERAKEAAAEKAEAIEGLELETGAAFADFYYGRLMALSGNWESVFERWGKAVEHKDLAPEIIGAFMHTDMRTTSWWVPVNGIKLGPSLIKEALLPFQSRAYNLHMMTMTEYAHPERVLIGENALIPRRYMGHFLEACRRENIGQKLAEMGMHDRAAVVYREIAYFVFDHANLGGTRPAEGTWLSARAAPYWAKAAEQAYLAGDIDSAAVLAAKAYVFGDDESRGNVRDMLERWQAKPADELTQKPEPDVDTLKGLMEFYVDWHVHPRAIELMNEYSEIFEQEEAERLRERIELHWLEKIGIYHRVWDTIVTSEVFLFGQALPADKEGQLAFRIPAPAPEYAREKAILWIRNAEEKYQREMGE